MTDDLIPFSNGTEFMCWHSNNCSRCLKYENESTNEKDAGCPMAYHIDIGTILGTVPKSQLERVGGVAEGNFFRIGKTCLEIKTQ